MNGVGIAAKLRDDEGHALRHQPRHVARRMYRQGPLLPLASTRSGHWAGILACAICANAGQFRESTPRDESPPYNLADTAI